MNDIHTFKSPLEFRTWLSENHLQADAIWLRISKKGSGEPTLSYSEALDEALCFGWIDGQKKPLDDSFWLQRFSRRRAKSGWSKINTQHVERLIEEGRMETAGLAEVEAAKLDGRWTAAYDSPSKATFPEDFLEVLSRDKTAEAFFKSLNKANLYAISYRLQTAKRPETRQKRMEIILAMLSKGESFH